ncbi:MAG: branched-chain-amino-acid transaminase [Candidatus Aminicenantes bacterium RBG_19FT_COMBO_58_17]|jgi:branched-chain amino acid aminotransferase|nr:MAG: branched-chain-amino-acid transaminase [Candidatus Aminicenantes bacterium RBG_19FT_COMBO_58_17]
MFSTTHFPKALKYWHEGKIYGWTDAHVHPMVHALHYGSSVFEGIRAYSTAKGIAIFRLKEHLDRFLYSAAVAKMDVPYTREDITQVIKLTLKENKLESAYIRPLLFFSYGNLGLVPKFCPVELVVATWEWGAYLGEKSVNGVSVCIVPWRRLHHSQLDMKAKLGGAYIQSTICGLESRAEGYDEAVFLNLEGNVAEGPGENIFISKDGVLKTNDTSESILEGITRTSLLEMARDSGLKTVIGPISREELFTADEAFFSGTAVEVTPIIRVTDASNPGGSKREYVIGSGQVGETTRRLRQMFKEVVTGQIKKYEKWLTFVER